MSDIAGGNGSDTPMERRRRVALRRIVMLREERNRSTVKASLVAEDTPFSSKEMSSILTALEDEGHLEKWGASTPSTYLIKLPEDYEPPRAP